MIEVKNNAVLRDGQQIAVIEGGVCRSYSAFPPVVKGQIKKAAGNASLTFELVEETQEPKAPLVQAIEAIEEKPGLAPEAAKLLQLAKDTAQGKPLVEAVAELEAQPLPRTIADLHALAEKGTIPKPPATHEALGSRTPAFVQWVKAHLSPEDFEAAYRGRKLPTIEEVESEFAKLSRTLRQQEEASKDQNGGIRF